MRGVLLGEDGSLYFYEGGEMSCLGTTSEQLNLQVIFGQALTFIEVDPPDKAFAFPSRRSVLRRAEWCGQCGGPRRKIAPPVAARRLATGARGEG
jgi:hypothetical protein